MSHLRLPLAALFMIGANAFGQTSFWTSQAPRTPQVTNTASVTLGLKFSSTVAGTVQGVRFYKGSRNTGTHVGVLWSSAGVPLANVTFTGETASGWQQAYFWSPVAIAANTTYIVSYSAPNGAHAHDSWFSWSGFSSGSLRVPGASPSVFAYGSGLRFPTETWQNSNYWVDVIFSTSQTPAPPPPTSPSTYTISGRVSGSSATVVLSGAASRSTNTDGSGNYSFTGLANGSYVVAPSRSGYTFNPPTAVVNVNNSSPGNINFTGAANSNPVQRSVTLSWNASTTGGLRGYNVYRASVAGGTYSKLTPTPTTSLSFYDATVASGRTYWYFTTAVNSSNVESLFSNQAVAVVP